jgi:hypothetical protein
MKVYTLNWYYDAAYEEGEGIVNIYSDLSEAVAARDKLTLEETIEEYPSLFYYISEYTLK